MEYNILNKYTSRFLKKFVYKYSDLIKWCIMYDITTIFTNSMILVPFSSSWSWGFGCDILTVMSSCCPEVNLHISPSWEGFWYLFVNNMHHCKAHWTNMISLVTCITHVLYNTHLRKHIFTCCILVSYAFQLGWSNEIITKHHLSLV